ncbi:MAG: glycosyltransferase [Clostridia bacterium]|nr:glycosyltransferase [Clostridia bacterium]
MSDKYNKQEEKILLSIIVPVYNVEKYLGDCLDSLTRQNFNSMQYEVIVINDGSTDNTAKVALEYANKYDYIKFFNQENRGVAETRNRGIKLAQGKYVTFVDSDDFVVDNIYVDIISVMERDGLEGLYFGQTTDLKKLQKFNGSYYFPKKEDSCKMSSCRVIFLKKIIDENNISFEKGIYYNEDFLFNYKFIQCMSKGMAGSAECLYYIRMRGDSSTARIRLLKENTWEGYYNCLICVAREIKRFNEEKNLPCDNLYYNSMSSVLQSLLWGAMIYKKSPSKTLIGLKENDLSLKDIKYKQRYGNSFKNKIKIWLAYNFKHKIIFKLSCYIYKIFKR